MSLPHLLLGLLSHQACSGYDLNKAVQSTIHHFWSTDQSQIYRALHRMEGDGWLTAETIIQDDNPNKKVYHITSDGLAELRRWVMTPVGTEAIRESWLGQLFFGSVVDRDELLALLVVYRDEALERLHTLEALQLTLPGREQRPHIPLQYQLQLLTLDYGLERHRFEVGWLENVMEHIRAMNLEAASSVHDKQ